MDSRSGLSPVRNGLTWRPVSSILTAVKRNSGLRYALAGAALLLLIAAGCTPSVRAPGFELRGVTADSSSGLLVSLSVSNPNNFALKARDLEYRILIDSNVCGTGDYPGPLQVKARDTAIVEFPLQVNLENVLRSLPSVLNDTVSVRVIGSYSAVTPVGIRRLKLDRAKRIALKDEFRAAMRRLFQ